MIQSLLLKADQGFTQITENEADQLCINRNLERIMNIDLMLVHAKILVQDSAYTLLEDGAVAVDKGRIAAVGLTSRLTEQFQAYRVIDASSKLLIPGLVNTHNHLFQTLMRGLGKDETFLNWIAVSIRRFMPYLDEEACYLAAMVGCLEGVRSGTTTVVDSMYANLNPSFSDAVIQAFEDLGIRGVLARGICDLEKFPGSTHRSLTYEPIDQCLGEIDRIRSRYKDRSLLSMMLAPGAVWNMTREGMVETARYARANDLKITMHLLETKTDDDFCLEEYGKRALPFLDEIGFLGPDLLAVHAIRLEKEDLDLLEKYQVKVSHNPLSNMILGSGVSPVTELVRRGIKIGLGTDGAASNDSQNMIETMKIAAILQKAFQQDATALSARSVFSMATDQGASVIGMQEQIGSLEPGKCADIIIVDLMKPNTTPSYEPISSLVYSGSERNIVAVIVAGQVIFENGRFLRVNEEEILQRVNQKAFEIFRMSEG